MLLPPCISAAMECGGVGRAHGLAALRRRRELLHRGHKRVLAEDLHLPARDLLPTQVTLSERTTVPQTLQNSVEDQQGIIDKAQKARFEPSRCLKTSAVAADYAACSFGGAMHSGKCVE